MSRYKSRVIIAAILLAAALSGVNAEDVNASIDYGGRNRTYTLHVPPQYNGVDSMPLVLNLHGGGGSPQQQAMLSEMNPKADSEGFLVLYPNGTMLPIGYFGWNAGEWSLSDVDDVGFISTLLDTVEAGYRIDTLRIYATGFSMGAMMCHRLACELAGKIAAFAPVEGGLTLNDWNSCQPGRLVPIMHFHHRYDASVPYYGDPTKKWAPAIDSVMRHWAQKNGCGVGPDSFYNEKGALRQRWSRPDDSCEVVFWTLEQGNGHAWPGTPTGSPELSANDLMWEFFSAHPIPVEEPEPGVLEPIEHPGPGEPSSLEGLNTIFFSLAQSECVRLDIFDVLGRRVAVPVSGILEKGGHSVVLDQENLRSGVYFYRLSTASTTSAGRIIVIK